MSRTEHPSRTQDRRAASHPLFPVIQNVKPIAQGNTRLFKLSNGKYIAPQQIESLLKQSEFVNQVVVVGSSRKYPAALIVPEWEALKAALRSGGEQIAETRAEISRQPAAIKLVQRDVTATTAHLADYERVRRVALLPDEFSIDNGEMTPTLKVKRRVVDEKYGELIDELFRS